MCGDTSCHHDNSLAIAPERKFAIEVHVLDEFLYGEGQYLIVLKDEGPRVGAPVSEALVYGEASDVIALRGSLVEEQGR